ncbi:Rubrerythrin [Desulfarculus baarsii DSM 2075]|uniref:Rubrerythrin n=1 Tax=Desulfarculus baarsii (strain ATCC 33931 / DSM 2075 / LMG 7858 / VKM B-1802 / 2st14) TaxID=644282 RepID=E1QDD1_DESB2|nr:ferritin family protein [Desulfarculus baarsii]ADK83450.1 Rubrerythrin [Desulfarculus baarsii DSM 2075]
MRQWKCTVCGHLHQGKYPPENCPKCGADINRFILLEELPEALEKMLREAFAGESKAHMRNLSYAKVAVDEGYPQIAALFRAVAEAERVHAAEYLLFLQGVAGTTEENLKQAFESESSAEQSYYPPIIQEAFAQKRDDVAYAMVRARDVEQRHAQLYKEALNAMVNDRQVEYHVCQVCGYVFENQPPDECPVCRAPRAQFKKTG